MPAGPRYTLADWDPDRGQTMEAWALELAEAGWRTWAGPGTWATINGRRVWRVELRWSPPASGHQQPDQDRGRDRDRDHQEQK